MKLTKAQRHRIYKICLNDCISQEKKGECYFICWTLWGYFGLVDKFGCRVLKDDLPELIKRKPDGWSGAWWPDYDYKTRIKVLRACIRETAPKKNKNR